MKKVSLVLSTVSGEEEGVKIAAHLVENGFAACVNVVPAIRSVYRWKGKMYDEKESLLLVKTSKEFFKKVESEIRKVHSYDLPEVISVTIAEGSEPYIGWILDSLSAG